MPQLRSSLLLCRPGGFLKITALVLSEALFLWMFFAADALEQLASAGAFGDSPEAAEAAFDFAASWRHGMAGNSPLYMPGFFAVAVSAWMVFQGAKLRGLTQYVAGLVVAALIAAAAAPAGGSLVLSAFESATGLFTSRETPPAGANGAFMGVYTLLTWTVFVIGCRTALHWRTFAPLLPAVPLTASLAALRPWTMDDFTTVWLHRAAAGDLVAILSLVMVPATAAYLYQHPRPRRPIEVTVF